MKKTKQRIKNYDQNPVEAVRDLGGAVAKSFKEDLAKQAVEDLWKQLLGVEEPKKQQKLSGELTPGQELDLKVRNSEPGIDYAREIIHAEKDINTKEKYEVRARIQEIQMELKKVINSSKELQVEFKDVSMEQLPVNPGKFHVNFFEWILSQIVNARTRIEDAVHWSNAIKGKKNQKQYWSLFKKHGTSFGLSSERTVATQVG